MCPRVHSFSVLVVLDQELGGNGDSSHRWSVHQVPLAWKLERHGRQVSPDNWRALEGGCRTHQVVCSHKKDTILQAKC